MLLNSTCTGQSLDWSCCRGQCQLGQGDCDHDFNCAGDLVCGVNNCKDFHRNADNEADCCTGTISSENKKVDLYWHSPTKNILSALSAGCKDLKGQHRKEGDSCMCEDGCNTCVCGAGGLIRRTKACPRRLYFSPFVILMSTTNNEKDSLLGQTVLPPEPSQFFKKEIFFHPPR